ncbi:MAG: TolC family protein [Thermodesulfobacteriota bacterium]|nr:TolC family protein [Thermodesulfobacteriota bacterium]
MGKNYLKLRQRLAGSSTFFVVGSLILLVLFPSSSEAKGITEEELVLSLEECIRLALKNNPDIMIERMNSQVQEMELLKEKAVFDPLFALETIERKSINQPTTILSGAGKDEFGITPLLGWEANLEQESFIFNSRISKKLVTGGKWELKFTNNRFKTNSIFQYYDKTYSSSVTLSLMQPLLRDSGVGLNKTKIRIASNNRDISIDAFKMKVTAVISELQETYWDLVAAFKGLNVRSESLKFAQNLLTQNKALVDAGRLAPIDILQAENGIVSRKEGILLARNEVKEAEDRLRKMIGLIAKPDKKERPLFPINMPNFIEKEIDIADSYEIALINRPSLNQAKITLANQKLALNLVKNQLLPKLDLLASYSLEGTDSEYGDNIDELSQCDNYSWEAGIVLEIPLGNRWAKNRYSQEKMRLQIAELKLDNLRKDILFDVKRVVREIETNQERIDIAHSARALAQKKLDAEKERFRLGRSRTINLLQFQQELTLARINEDQARIDYQKSLVHWETLTGQTIAKNNIEIVSH